MSPRILFLGGGSIGHLAPCVSVWRAVQKMEPHAEAFFLCSERDAEADFLRKEQIQFEQLPLFRRSLIFPFTFLRTRSYAKKVIKRFRPDILFSKGGSLSIAPCIAAVQKKIPIVLHESDAVMGRANQFLSRYADINCLGFPKSNYQLSPLRQAHFAKASRTKGYEGQAIINYQFVGNPIRPEITRGSREEGLRITGLSGNRPIVLVLGGSQGAQAINEVIWQHLEELLEMCDVVHITGHGKNQTILNSQFSILNSARGYWNTEFAHEQLPHLYALANLAVSRGGAGSISELAANGIATIIIPLKGLAQNHQVENAKRAAACGGCIHVPQGEMHQELISEIRSLIEDPGARKEIAEKIRSLFMPDAAERIAEILLKISNHGLTS